MDRQRPLTRRLPRIVAAALAIGMVLAASPLFAQYNGQAGVTNGLYGRPTSQPYFDFPNWARFSNCRPGPLPWGYEVFPEYGPVDCACNGVPSVGCPGEFVAHRPSSWYATADFVPMTIDYGGPGLEIARIGPLGPTVLSVGDLDAEFDAGGEFTIGRRIFDCYRLEATYLGMYHWFDETAITNNDPVAGGTGNLSTLLSQFANPIVPGLDENAFVSIANRSSFYSAEVNMRYWIDMPPGPFDVSFLVGGRFMRINEQFNFLSIANVPAPAGAVNDVQVDTRNDLLGLQIGFAGDWLIHPRYWVNLDVKGAILDNKTGQDTSYINTDNNGVVTTFLTGAEQDRTAWMIDLSLVGSWQMTPTLSLRAGYQATWIDGVALGFENLQTDNALLRAGPGQLNDNGSVIYHGPILGLMWIR